MTSLHCIHSMHCVHLIAAVFDYTLCGGCRWFLLEEYELRWQSFYADKLIVNFLNILKDHSLCSRTGTL